MIGNLIFCAYIAAGLLTARKVAYAAVLDIDATDTADRMLCAMVGLFFGAIWPAVLVVALAAKSIPKTPTELKARAEETEARAKAAEEIVRQFAAEHGESGKRGIIVSGDDSWPF